jgi:hypothetical protein
VRSGSAGGSSARMLSRPRRGEARSGVEVQRPELAGAGLLWHAWPRSRQAKASLRNLTRRSNRPPTACGNRLAGFAALTLPRQPLAACRRRRFTCNVRFHGSYMPETPASATHRVQRHALRTGIEGQGFRDAQPVLLVLATMGRNSDRKREKSRRSYLAECSAVGGTVERASRGRAAPRSQGWPEGQPGSGLSGLPVLARLRRDRLALLE